MNTSSTSSNTNTTKKTAVNNSESKNAKKKEKHNSDDENKEVSVLEVLKEIHQSYQNDIEKEKEKGQGKDKIDNSTKNKDKKKASGDNDVDSGRQSRSDDDKNSDGGKKKQHQVKHHTAHEKTKAKRDRHHYHPTSSTDDGRIYEKPVGWKAILADDVHKTIALFNEVISLTLELAIYIGGIISFFNAFFSHEVRVMLDCLLWWIIAMGLLIYTVADCFRLFKPFDQSDMIIRHALPPWVTKYLIASRFSVAVCANELIATGERALLYKPFCVPKRYVSHVAFSVGVILSILYSLVNAKEATRKSEKMKAKEDIDDNVVDIKNHVLQTVRDSVLDVVKVGVQKTTGE